MRARDRRWVAGMGVLGLVWGAATVAEPQDRPRVERVMVVVLENADYEVARTQPFLAKLGREGGLLRQSFAVAHPSQPNYLALIAGSTYGVDSNAIVTPDVPHLGDLLEAKGRTWKVYAEGYPGGCFLASGSDLYVRRHVPFLSFKNVQDEPARCSRIVEAAGLATDIRQGTLPDCALYVPDVRHDGHDTGVRQADQWLSETFAPLLSDPRFTANLLFIVTFDEARRWWRRNHVYTVMYGASVIPGSVANTRYDHYSLLRTIEDLFGLGTLGQHDATASPITGIWRGKPL